MSPFAPEKILGHLRDLGAHEVAYFGRKLFKRAAHLRHGGKKLGVDIPLHDLR